MQRYLQPLRLEELDLQQFDAWTATFRESVTALEIAPDGSGYRMHTRFARFINVPELMAASGNPMVIEKVGVDADVAKLATLFSVWRNQRYENEREAAWLPRAIEVAEDSLIRLERDMTRAQPCELATIRVEIDGRHHTGPEAVGGALRGIILAAKEAGGGRLVMHDRKIGAFAGFELGLTLQTGEKTPSLYLTGATRYEIQPRQTTPALVAMLRDTLASIPKQRDQKRERLELHRKRLLDIQIELERPFEHQRRLAALQERQRVLLKVLDLDRDEAGTGRAEVEAMAETA